MTMSEYLSVIRLMTEHEVQDSALKVYTADHNFTGYAVGNPQDGVVYFSSELPAPGAQPFVDPGKVYSCVALEAILVIEITIPEVTP
jgi:hypothetical protein